VRRYERSRPGELIHIDVKKLGRIVDGAGHRIVGRQAQRRNPAKTDGSGVRRLQVGWERVHVCIDDATRLAYVEVLPDEKAKTAIGFLRRALAFYRSHGIEVERLMTDNGSAYVSVAHALACKALGIKHIRTRPYRPQTNGKAERFIRTMLREWAYAAVYGSSPREGRGPLGLGRALQLQTTTWRPRSPAADSSAAGAEGEQRGWHLHLDHPPSISLRVRPSGHRGNARPANFCDPENLGVRRQLSRR